MEESTPPRHGELRIRHISGIGVHELTLPDVRDRAGAFPFPLGGSPRPRRTSHASETAPLSRSRAPTLAGEGRHPGVPLPTNVSVIEEGSSEGEPRPLARCFVAFSMPSEPSTPTASMMGSPPSPPHSPLPTTTSYSATDVKKRPSTTRSRTASLPPKPLGRTSTSPTSPTSPLGSPVTRRSQLNGTSPRTISAATPAKVTGPGVRPAPVRRSTLGFPRASSEVGLRTPQVPQVPFFLSPIHDPSTHPRWAHLEPGDFASWLSVPEDASTRVEIALWAEERGRWRKQPGIGGVVDLAQLVPIPPGMRLAPNTLTWTFTNHPKNVWYLPPSGTSSPPHKDTEKGVVERSMRETRMKKSSNVGRLHQLVNMQSVVADTKRSIDDMQRQIDRLLTADRDRSAVRRDIGERALHARWVRDRIAEVERSIEETKARITLHRGRLDARRALLAAAAERAEQTQSGVAEMTASITIQEEQRTNMLPAIYRLRAKHAQALDALFPIEPLSAPHLLYSIIGVPLPIPQGPKDPAPPLALSPAQLPESCPKVDERTTAAALGYAALLVQLVANLGGTAAGLAYPITYAGSRSHVRDVVSVMQGPRSFPLYGKGVERYRYEYAVFLLNKNIELLMHEGDIRMMDLRQTLPNLKNLLLTLSSPEPPPPGPVAGPGWASGAASRASSRQASAAWSMFAMDRIRSSSSASPQVTSPSALELQNPEYFESEHDMAAASVVSVMSTSEGGSADAASTGLRPTTPPPRGVRRSFTSPSSGLRKAVVPGSDEDSPEQEEEEWVPEPGPNSVDSGLDLGEDKGDGDSEATVHSDDTETEGYVVGKPVEPVKQQVTGKGKGRTQRVK